MIYVMFLSCSSVFDGYSGINTAEQFSLISGPHMFIFYIDKLFLMTLMISPNAAFLYFLYLYFLFYQSKRIITCTQHFLKHSISGLSPFLFCGTNRLCPFNLGGIFSVNLKDFGWKIRDLNMLILPPCILR